MDIKKEGGGSMNLSQLEYMSSAVEEGSYAEAAKKQFVTVQAICKSIRALESELGVNLMEKKGRGVEPTPMGLYFADQSRLILAEIEKLKACVRKKPIKDSSLGECTIAVCSAECRGELFSRRAERAFGRRNPDMSLNVLRVSNDSCANLLIKGDADAAILLGGLEDSEACYVRYFKTIEPLFAVSYSNSLAKKSGIEISDLNGRPLALPTDTKYCLERLKHCLDVTGAHPVYKSVRLNGEEHRKFLEDGGVVMVLGG